MGWRFRKSFKLLPGFRINIGKKGISSATVGKRGLSASVGKSGVFRNIGIPGTGISHRSKIGGGFPIVGIILAFGLIGVLLIGFIAAYVMALAFLSSPPNKVTPISSPPGFAASSPNLDIVNVAPSNRTGINANRAKHRKQR